MKYTKENIIGIVFKEFNKALNLINQICENEKEKN
jgi:hypothetical protein